MEMEGIDFDTKRKELVKYLVASGFLKSGNIIEAFESTPRHSFVPEKVIPFAYEDMALPTVKASTISQPSTVATMLEILGPKTGEKILEIGTGSGWEACILSKCVGAKGKVVTIEIDRDVADFANKNISNTGHKNIINICGDGSVGYIDEAPYDKVIYTAAAPEIPRQLILQLRINGRTVAPVGKDSQVLRIVDKLSDSKTEEHSYGMFQFVPLRGMLGF
ncbi:MAG: protein-L-isoaspartate(D-aspartate) O-methyltransferase [Candidatus Marsarchaeota archaeon]|nr:protein-L-isoaspartate(D-aspartate) O-methyltransferase [Candidatus Marsarchaeota archaeon]